MVEERPPRRQPADVRREQLLDAAQQVLTSNGLRSTTVSDVAEAAGVAKGTMYLYFRSKDELLAGLRARYMEQYAGALGKDAGSVRDRIRAVVVGLYAVGTKNHDLHHLLFHEAGFSEDDAFIAVRERLTELIAEGAESGELTVPDMRLAVSFVLHGIHGALVETLHGAHGRGRTRAANEVADLAVRVLDSSRR